MPPASISEVTEMLRSTALIFVLDSVHCSTSASQLVDDAEMPADVKCCVLLMARNRLAMRIASLGILRQICWLGRRRTRWAVEAL